MCFISECRATIKMMASKIEEKSPRKNRNDRGRKNRFCLARLFIARRNYNFRYFNMIFSLCALLSRLPPASHFSLSAVMEKLRF